MMKYPLYSKNDENTLFVKTPEDGFTLTDGMTVYGRFKSLVDVRIAMTDQLIVALDKLNITGIKKVIEEENELEAE